MTTPTPTTSTVSLSRKACVAAAAYTALARRVDAYTKECAERLAALSLDVDAQDQFDDRAFDCEDAGDLIGAHLYESLGMSIAVKADRICGAVASRLGLDLVAAQEIEESLRAVIAEDIERLAFTVSQVATGPDAVLLSYAQEQPGYRAELWRKMAPHFGVEPIRW